MSALPTYNARDPSWKLLLSYLSRHQRQTLRECGFFYVQTKKGRVFALPGQDVFVAINKETGWPGTVYGAHLKDEDGLLFCVADNLLALFLALTTKPGRLLELACVDLCSYRNLALDSGQHLKGFLKERARLSGT